MNHDQDRLEIRWSGSRAASPMFVSFMALVAAIVGIQLINAGLTATAWSLSLLLVILLATYGYVRVDITSELLVARMGPWGWPRYSRRLEDIDRAEVVKVNPLRYGGWGHRLTLSTTAIVVRGDEGLLLVPKTGRRFLVTVSPAQDAARVINVILAERR